MLSGYQGSCPLEGAPSQCLIAISVLLGRGVPGLGTQGCGSLQNIAVLKMPAYEITYYDGEVFAYHLLRYQALKMLTPSEQVSH